MPHSIIRILSKQGFCSRKQAVELVKRGRVSFHGRVILDPGHKVPVDAKLTVSGDPVVRKQMHYILLNKPAGYVTTRSDELGRPTVYHFLKDVKGWIFPVGRLDKDTEGLLIFTNDTAFGEMMTNPASGIKRTYRAWIDGTLSKEDLRIIRSGAHIGRGQICRPAKIDILEPGNNGLELVEITLAEGKNREIRRIFDSLGKPVKRLVRIRFGRYALGSLKPGEWRSISVDSLFT
jgi:23S rRNA pseudouridine2605 synthase